MSETRYHSRVVVAARTARSPFRSAMCSTSSRSISACLGCLRVSFLAFAAEILLSLLFCMLTSSKTSARRQSTFSRNSVSIAATDIFAIFLSDVWALVRTRFEPKKKRKSKILSHKATKVGLLMDLWVCQAATSAFPLSFHSQSLARSGAAGPTAVWPSPSKAISLRVRDNWKTWRSKKNWLSQKIDKFLPNCSSDRWFMICELALTHSRSLTQTPHWVFWARESPVSCARLKVASWILFLGPFVIICTSLRDQLLSSKDPPSPVYWLKCQLRWNHRRATSKLSRANVVCFVSFLVRENNWMSPAVPIELWERRQRGVKEPTLRSRRSTQSVQSLSQFRITNIAQRKTWACMRILRM